MSKARMPVHRRHTNTTEHLRRKLHRRCGRRVKCIQATMKTTAKQNDPRVPILDKETKRVKLSKDIIITCKLRNGQQTTCSRGNSEDIRKMQRAKIVCKERGLTNMRDAHTCSIGGVHLIMTTIWLLSRELAHLAGKVVSSAGVHIPCWINRVGGSATMIMRRHGGGGLLVVPFAIVAEA